MRKRKEASAGTERLADVIWSLFEFTTLFAWRCDALKRLAMVLVAILVGLCMLSGCSTVGGAVDGTGKLLSKGGRAVKNI